MEIKIDVFKKIFLYLLGIENIDIENKLDRISRLYEINKINLGGFYVNYLYKYKNSDVKNTIHRMKFNNDGLCLDFFAKKLSSEIGKSLEKDKEYLIIPVPSTRKRVRERGAWTVGRLTEKVVRELIVSHNISHAPHSIFRHNSLPQSHIHTRKDRLNSMKNIFYTKFPELLAVKNIICIDDVCTTGATAKDIARVCFESKCNSFDVWVLAH